MKRAATHFSFVKQNRACRTFYFDLGPPPPFGQTEAEERKPDPRGNWYVRISRSRSGGDGQAWN